VVYAYDPVDFDDVYEGILQIGPLRAMGRGRGHCRGHEGEGRIGRGDREGRGNRDRPTVFWEMYDEPS
jgi:hypothetical protein